MKHILSLSFLLFTCAVFAQDMIYKHNGETIKATILETNSSSVVFRYADDPTGPTYRLKKSEIKKLEYQNGLSQEFALNNNNIQPNVYGSNIVSIDMVSLVHSEVELGYERIIGNGTIGFKIPLILGFFDDFDEDYRNMRHEFVTGLDVNLYPTGQGEVKYFLGISPRFGKVQVKETFFDPFTNEEQEQWRDANSRMVILNNGLMFQPTDNLTVTGIFGLGFRNLDIRSDVSNTYATFSVTLGYRF